MKRQATYRSVKTMLRALVLLGVLVCAEPIYAGTEAMPADGAQVEIVARPQIKVSNGQVEINLPGEEARQVMVFALTGQLVKSVTVQPGVTVIDLPAGYYIVKCDRLSQRVIVR